MSKCHLEIDFYRPDRLFHSGEKVQGWVRVSVNKNVKCRELTATGFWATHGHGNVTKQSYFQTTLFQGHWQEGETYEYTFEFDPPEEPITYHGHYLNIDHYVSARVDVPWAIDPRAQEEFLLRPGPKPELPLELSAEPGPPASAVATACVQVAGLMLAAAILIGSVIAALQVAWPLILLSVVSPLVLFMVFRHKLAGQKLGQVVFELPRQATAGQAIPIQLKVGPIGNVRISRIAAILTGVETVVSGSGTDRTTYSHPIHDEKQILFENPAVNSQELIEYGGEIMIPETTAYTVDLPDNEIQWHVTLEIRMRWWPDWIQRRELIVLPQALAFNPNPAFDVQPAAALIKVLKNLEGADFSVQDVDRMIQQSSDQMFEIPVVVEKVGRATDSFEDPEYQSGRNLIGKIIGSQYAVAIQLPQSYNAQLDQLQPGDHWTATGALIRWDFDFGQLVALGI